MLLEGSCQCGKVQFSVESETPYPFMNCYCSICRKLSGGPYGCNLMGKRETLKVKGEKYLREYHARVRTPGEKVRISEGQRFFCGECGSHLYLLDDRWDYGVWPNAAAIDTPLPVPPEDTRVHIMLAYKPDWVPVPETGRHCREYPDISIADWHEHHGLTVRGAVPPKKRATAKPAATKPAKQRAATKPAKRASSRKSAARA